VHARGVIEILDIVEEQVSVLKRLVEHYGSPRQEPWKMSAELSQAPDKIDAIVCFRIRIDKIKFKKS